MAVMEITTNNRRPTCTTALVDRSPSAQPPNALPCLARSVHGNFFFPKRAAARAYKGDYRRIGEMKSHCSNLPLPGNHCFILGPQVSTVRRLEDSFEKQFSRSASHRKPAHRQLSERASASAFAPTFTYPVYQKGHPISIKTIFPKTPPPFPSFPSPCPSICSVSSSRESSSYIHYPRPLFPLHALYPLAHALPFVASDIIVQPASSMLVHPCCFFCWLFLTITV